MSCCGAAGAAADDDDDDAAADGAGFAVAVGGAAWGVLVLILVFFSVGLLMGLLTFRLRTVVPCLVLLNCYALCVALVLGL